MECLTGYLVEAQLELDDLHLRPSRQFIPQPGKPRIPALLLSSAGLHQSPEGFNVHSAHTARCH